MNIIPWACRVERKKKKNSNEQKFSLSGNIFNLFHSKNAIAPLNALRHTFSSFRKPNRSFPFKIWFSSRFGNYSQIVGDECEHHA